MGVISASIWSVCGQRGGEWRVETRGREGAEGQVQGTGAEAEAEAGKTLLKRPLNGGNLQ